MEQELYTLLDGLLGSYKLYPSVLPLDVDYPCARYILIYDDFEQTKDPYLSGLARFQLDIYSRDRVGEKSAFDVAHTLQETIKTAVNGWSGTTIREIRVRNVEKDYEEEIEAHISRIELNVYHT
tara:strand:- start:2185 stop:2556 length:372 start_codon:yes stop_codon:yes gene_type:complete